MHIGSTGQQRRIAGEVPEIPAQAAGDGIQPANIEHQRHAEHVALFHQPAVDLRDEEAAKGKGKSKLADRLNAKKEKKEKELLAKQV